MRSGNVLYPEVTKDPVVSYEVRVFGVFGGLTIVMDGDSALLRYLKDYTGRALEYLDDYWRKEQQRLAGLCFEPKVEKQMEELIEIYRAYMNGGKKVRGAMVQLGFECGGGDKEQVLPYSVGMEVLHSFMLMHDDVMDRDEVRRNKPTVHRQFAEKVGDVKLDRVHFGNSMAIVLGDLGCFWGATMLSDDRIPAEQVVKGMRYLWGFLLNTGYGQAQDMWNELEETISEEQLMQVHLHKTAYYTIAGPLQYGGILGGIGAEQLAAMETFGRAIGTAFQLRDDELGMFGDEQQLGKPLGSDIKAGKNTLLTIKALELSSESDREFLRNAYGNLNIQPEEIERVKQITRDCGALAYSEQKCSELIAEGTAHVAAITEDENKQQILFELAEYIYKRGK